MIPDGYIIWFRGKEVIGIQKPAENSEREKFLNLFGLTRAAPKAATGAGLSRADYAALTALSQLTGE